MSLLKNILEGKPLGHPLHPLLVHFTIGFFFLSMVLDVANLLTRQETLVQSSFYCILLGLISALVAAVPGLVDFTSIRKDRPGKRTATAHMILNLLAVGCYGMNLGTRIGLDTATVSFVPVAFSVVGLGLLTVSGYLGGTLVYDQGIGVGRHRRHSKMPETTVRLLSKDAPANPNGGGTSTIPVAGARKLQDGESMRVELDGVAMVLTRLGETYYAFQDACTHRCAPLSEGSFRMPGEVECPWHRSRFDLTTGQVTQGPAKLDLRVFPVELRNGEVCVGLPVPGEGTQGPTVAIRPP